MRDDEFLGPLPGGFVERAARAVLPAALKWRGVEAVEYDSGELARLRRHLGNRILFAPNHPTNNDPAILFHLANVLNERFLFLACRESFDVGYGLWGHVSRRLGAYSVVRGTADRASFRATREFLAAPRSRVVIFPEGEVYSQNDSLLPFHSGAFQLAFWAQEDLFKSGDVGGILIQPVRIKYVFTRDATSAMQASLARLEKATGASTGPSDIPYIRLRRVGHAMLLSLEREYRLPTPANDDPDSDLSSRLDAVKEAILDRVALAVGLAPPRADTMPERMRALIHAVETVTRDEPSAGTPYDRKLRQLQRERAEALLRDLARLANWIAVHDGYVKANPTPERMADTLVRLERECFGESSLKGSMRCEVRLPEPIDLRDEMDEYKTDRRGTVARLARKVESRIAATLLLPAEGETP